MKEDMQLFADSPAVFHPHYATEDRSRIKAIVRFPDGRLTEMDVSKKEEGSAFLRDVYAQYSEEDIEANTRRENRLRDLREENDRIAHEDREREEARAALFRAKAKTLEIPEVKACPDASLQARIRKARSEAEIYSLAALALLRGQGL
jgi:uncharacterized membrane protein YqiK